MPKKPEKYLAEALEKGGEQAATYNVPLIYEPLNRYETKQCCTVQDGVSLLSNLNTDNVRLLCDLFHMNIEEADVAQALRDGGHWVGHIHFVDSNRQPVGLGHMQFGPIIEALREINYQGYLCAEAFPHPHPRKQLDRRSELTDTGLRVRSLSRCVRRLSIPSDHFNAKRCSVSSSRNYSSSLA